MCFVVTIFTADTNDRLTSSMTILVSSSLYVVEKKGKSIIGFLVCIVFFG